VATVDQDVAIPLDQMVFDVSREKIAIAFGWFGTPGFDSGQDVRHAVGFFRILQILHRVKLYPSGLAFEAGQAARIGCY
jgi:hypothetical protein